MSQAVKKKLCWNCEGNVPRETSNCPYCGVYLHREDDNDDDYEDIEEEITPPYSPQVDANKESFIPEAPYTKQREEAISQDEPVAAVAAPSVQISNSSSEWMKIAIPLILLLAGSIFVLLAFLIYFFSHNGALVLAWNARAWLVYALVGLPLLYFGYRSLSQLKE